MLLLKSLRFPDWILPCKTLRFGRRTNPIRFSGQFWKLKVILLSRLIFPKIILFDKMIFENFFPNSKNNILKYIFQITLIL